MLHERPLLAALYCSNAVVGVWSTTDRKGPAVCIDKAPAGTYRQVSRLGNPLINEVISPAGLKDAFNRLDPSRDHTVQPLVNRVLNPEVPQLIEKIYKIKAPATPRKDLSEIFLTGISKNSGGPIKADLNSELPNKDIDPKRFTPAEELRLNMAVPQTAKPNRLGVLAGDLQGFPNGRRLTDDVVDIELQALEGATQTGKLVPALAKGDRVDRNDKQFGRSFPYLALPHNSGSGKAMPNGGAGTGGGSTSGLQHTGLLGLDPSRASAAGTAHHPQRAETAPAAPEVRPRPALPAILRQSGRWPRRTASTVFVAPQGSSYPAETVGLLHPVRVLFPPPGSATRSSPHRAHRGSRPLLLPPWGLAARPVRRS
ncbi:DUF4331 domain-containing protein [Actinomadura sp. NPDC023710]|uniref:DUF4331 domain-containing protein n=1 Tax=Actinomadura sp. NPDC023710 TaxID=3158219 RepID=UPI0033CD59C1